jgi:hypothetical protein
MVVVPAPMIVTVRPDIVATDALLLVKVNAPPGLFDEGSVRLNGASPKFFDATVYVWKVGVIGNNNNGMLAVLLVLAPEADWVTVIVVEPPIVLGKTIFPHISAMAELPIV